MFPGINYFYFEVRKEMYIFSGFTHNFKQCVYWYLLLSIMSSGSQSIDAKIWRRFISVDTNEYFFVFLLQTQFDITVASEIMAILALTTDLQDMRTRFASYTFMFSCHVPFSQTTGNHVKPTAASLSFSFIHKTTP